MATNIGTYEVNGRLLGCGESLNLLRYQIANCNKPSMRLILNDRISSYGCGLGFLGMGYSSHCGAKIHILKFARIKKSFFNNCYKTTKLRSIIID